MAAIKFPPNFSWVVDGFLAALAFPSEPDHLRYLAQQEIKYLISLTAEGKPPVEKVPELTWVHIKIVDFTPPSLEQVEEFLKVVRKARSEGRSVAIHCAAGRGRTGTMIACHLVSDERLTARDAIKLTRQLRPGSVETLEQEQLVERFEQKLRAYQNWRPVKSQQQTSPRSLQVNV